MAEGRKGAAALKACSITSKHDQARSTITMEDVEDTWVVFESPLGFCDMSTNRPWFCIEKGDL